MNLHPLHPWGLLVQQYLEVQPQLNLHPWGQWVQPQLKLLRWDPWVPQYPEPLGSPGSPEHQLVPPQLNQRPLPPWGQLRLNLRPWGQWVQWVQQYLVTHHSQWHLFHP